MKQSSPVLPYISIGCLLLGVINFSLLTLFGSPVHGVAEIVMGIALYAAILAGFVLALVALARNKPRAVLTIYALALCAVIASILLCDKMAPYSSLAALIICLFVYASKMNLRLSPEAGITFGFSGLCMSGTCVAPILYCIGLKTMYADKLELYRKEGMESELEVSFSHLGQYEMIKNFSITASIAVVLCGVAGIVYSLRLKKAGNAKAFAAGLALSVAAILGAALILVWRFTAIDGKLLY